MHLPMDLLGILKQQPIKINIFISYLYLLVSTNQILDYGNLMTNLLFNGGNLVVVNSKRYMFVNQCACTILFIVDRMLLLGHCESRMFVLSQTTGVLSFLILLRKKEKNGKTGMFYFCGWFKTLAGFWYWKLWNLAVAVAGGGFVLFVY